LNTYIPAISAGVGFACQTALARNKNVLYRIKTDHFEKRRGVIIINNLRAQKGNKAQATCGLAGKPHTGCL
jgi:hypothetical protein